MQVLRRFECHQESITGPKPKALSPNSLKTLSPKTLNPKTQHQAKLLMEKRRQFGYDRQGDPGSGSFQVIHAAAADAWLEGLRVVGFRI